jgi:hypothetical protein
MTLIQFLEKLAHVLVSTVGFIELLTGIAYLLLYWLAGNPRHAGLATTWLAYGLAVVGLYFADR